MVRSLFGIPRSLLVFTLIVPLAACGHSHKPAESADDFTPKGWSDATNDSATVSTTPADPSIQPAAPSTQEPSVAASTPPPAPEPTPAPAASSPDEAAVLSGNALPPGPTPSSKATKTSKSSKGKHRKKKKSTASP